MLVSAAPGMIWLKRLFLIIPLSYYALGTAVMVHTYWIAIQFSHQETVVTPFGMRFPKSSYQTGNAIVALCSLVCGMAGCLVRGGLDTDGIPPACSVIMAFGSGVLISVGFVLYPAWIGATAVCCASVQGTVLFLVSSWRPTQADGSQTGLRRTMLPSVPEEWEWHA